MVRSTNLSLVAILTFWSLWVSSSFPISTTTQLRKKTSVFAATKGRTGSPQKNRVVVALTREDGKNDKLRKALLSHPRLSTDNTSNSMMDNINLSVEELPCIAHANGPDLENLGTALKSQHWDYIAITSPEAARVLAGSWNFEIDSKSDSVTLPKVAAVGKATQQTLEELNIAVTFCPSKATAQTLVNELPDLEGDKPTTLLYPASAKAKTTLQDGLKARGFDVLRLDTYDTVTATWTPEQEDMAKCVTVLCVGSPSALDAWLVNSKSNKDVIAACIGETSYKACIENQWTKSRIFYPDRPGVPGWANSVADAVEAIALSHTHKEKR